MKERENGKEQVIKGVADGANNSNSAVGGGCEKEKWREKKKKEKRERMKKKKNKKKIYERDDIQCFKMGLLGVFKMNNGDQI